MTFEYDVLPDGCGAWLVLDPSGDQVAYFGRADGELAHTLAEAHAAEKTFELRFMADFLGVSRERFVAGLHACRSEVDGMVARGAL
jgi:hypothetical protein